MLRMPVGIKNAPQEEHLIGFFPTGRVVYLLPNAKLIG
jgi:hypothetical protein